MLGEAGSRGGCLKEVGAGTHSQTIKDHYPQKKNVKVIGLMKDELSGKKKELVTLRPKIYLIRICYVTNDGYVHRKPKGTKNAT